MVEKFRLQVWYTGRVQGVGFRYKAAQIAKGYDVGGVVRNLEDGRVHLEAVGEENEVREFVEALEKSMCDFIKESYQRADFTSDNYRGFSIEL